mgnify:CR=1 FL=1
MDKQIENIYKQTEELFIQKVTNFLKSDETSVQVPRLPIDEIRKILKKLNKKLVLLKIQKMLCFKALDLSII